ncbi:tripartite tricarboxylate transporter permease [Radiobacillus sp. PE A8.2]|uniref:tripartite tricarboxylate transporter permease n=1 Tax=Radiobacillus sp. PE A8.2 TaxID=3380349 RepID=UPI003890FFB0
MFDIFMSGLAQIFDWKILIFMNIGLLIGIIFGAIPGLTGNLGIIIFLPFSFAMEPATSIIFLMAIYIGGELGGSVSGILIGTPGTNAGAATMLDGYPLAKKGHGKKALLSAFLSSTVGGVISAIVLLIAAPSIANFTIHFGPPEYFALAIFGLSIIAGISGKNMYKGLIAGCIGVLLSMVGMDNMSGSLRFTFESVKLMNGLPLLPLLIGIFAIPSIMEKTESKKSDKVSEKIKMNENDTLTKEDIKRTTPAMLKGSLIGTIIGAIPGAGTGIASFISYDEARRSSKNSRNFGKGELEGVAASESANNGVVAASLIPLLTLGIPGSPAAAVLIGAFMIQGMVPGPTLFQDQGVIVYTIMIGILIASIFMYLQGRVLAKYFVKVTHVPHQIMVPVLVLMCTAGAFAADDSVFGMKVFIIFGIMSYILMKLDFPAVPIVLGFVLGPLLEFNLRRSLVMSEGEWSIFFTRPISLVFIVITLVILIYSTIKSKKENNELLDESI